MWPNKWSPFFGWGGIGIFFKNVYYLTLQSGEQRTSQWEAVLLNQGTESPPSMVAQPGKEVVQRMCAEEEAALWGWGQRREDSYHLYRDGNSLVCLRIFAFIISVKQRSEKSVSGLKTSLSLWIMNLNEAFCVDYLMIYSNGAVTLGYAEEKIYRMCSGGIFIHGLSLWFIIMIYSIWKANSLIPNDRLFFFSVKKATLTSLREELTVRGESFLSSWSLSKCGWL